MKRIVAILALLLSNTLFASVSGGVESPFTHKTLETDSIGEYSFIVSGHFHGSGTNRTGYPTNTLLANLDWLNESDATMVMCLGDLFLDVSNDIPNYEASLFSKLNKPLFNSVGNHDITGTIYQDNFGKTYSYFILNNDIHLVLDTELDDGSIKDEQLELFKEVEDLVNTDKYTNVFIYSHRTIWTKSYSELDLLFSDNTQSILGNNFESEILPRLESIQKKANVFWFSGSLGSAPASFFQFKKGGIQYIATAIRGLPRDAVLIVDVKQGVVSFRTKSFTNSDLLPFESYDVDFWTENQGKEPFNYRLLPLYIKQFFLNPNYWYGFASMLFIAILFYWRKRKKSLNSH